MSQALAAPEPSLVQDLLPGTFGSSPAEMLEVNGTLYFSATDGLHGRELWRSDGTAAGTVLVKDIVPGTSSSKIRLLGSLGNTLYFLASNQLWKTDGTEAGTTVLQGGELRFSGAYFSNDHLPVATLNGVLFFVAPGASVTDTQVWRTDGTDAGTFAVSSGGHVSRDFLASVSGSVLFMRPSSDTTLQLWKTDGTVAGTVLVGELPAELGRLEPEEPPGLVGGMVFFRTTSIEESYPQLWRTDGTLEGTVRVLRGERSVEPHQLTPVGGKLFFLHSGALWQSDGTSAGTSTINGPWDGPSGLGEVDGALLLFAYNGLYRSDGTSEGTTRLSSLSFSGGRAVGKGSTRFFVALDASFSTVLWKTDGTPAGTTAVTPVRMGSYDFFDNDLPPVPFNGAPMVAAGNLVFFFGADQEVWRSDGTPAGTFSPRDINALGLHSYPQYLTAVGDALYFTTAHGSRPAAQLWRADGTGATLLKESDSMQPLGDKFLSTSGGRLLFASSTGLWASDGTAAGTEPIPNWHPNALVERQGTIFMTSHYQVLGRSDGTAAGTVVIKNSPGCCDEGSELVNAKGTLFFFHEPFNESSRVELWRSNGTQAGTFLVKAIFPGGASGFASAQAMTAVDNRVFFTVNDGQTFFHLWTSDGTAQGTRSLGVNAGPEGGMAVGKLFFFLAGPGLWRSDGTVAGTFQLKEFPTTYEMTDVNGTLFFAAPDSQNGLELWKSDGTEAGTVLVKDIHPGPGHSRPTSLTNVNGLLYFLATADGAEYEVWRSDGTAAGTVVVTTQLNGLPLLFPEFSDRRHPRMARAQGRLFFTARDAVHGQELWALPLSALTCPAPLVLEATSGSGAAAAYPSPTVAADATGTPAFTYAPPAGSMLPLGATQVSVSAPSLPPYLASSCDFTVTVRDTTPPAVSCPEPQLTQTSNPSGTAVSFPPATATDAVTSAPPLQYSHEPGSNFPVGATEVTVTATDAAGNTGRCGFTVTVEEKNGGGGGKEPGGGGCGATSPGALAAWLLLVLVPLVRARLKGERHGSGRGVL